MLDGLLGRGFSSKCKGLIKLTKTRIDVIRRKKDARQRIMKKDIADLLSNGLDINAYGRTEEFSAGLNILFCYDFIEQSCEYILKQLSVMQKQRECPEECRETVASLMFAAARFSDLPELRDLRDMFQERYGDSFEYYVNQKFLESLAPKPPTMEKKLQLLQDIALEFSIKWDLRGFEQRMATPSPFMQVQPGKNSPFHVTDDKHKIPNGKAAVPRTDKHEVPSEETFELVKDNALKREGLEFTRNGHKTPVGREETIPKREINADKHQMLNGKEEHTPKSRRSGNSSHGRRPEFTDGGYKLHDDGVAIGPGRGPGHLYDMRSEIPTGFGGAPFVKEGKDISPGGYNRGQLVNNGKEANTLKSRRSGNSSHGRMPEFTDGGYELHDDGVAIGPGRGSSHLYDMRSEISTGSAGAPVVKEGKDISPGGYIRGQLVNNGKEANTPKSRRAGYASQGRMPEFTDGGYELHDDGVAIGGYNRGQLVNNGKEMNTPKSRRPGNSSHGRMPEFTDGGYELHENGVAIGPGRGLGHLYDTRSEISTGSAGAPFVKEGKDISPGGYSRGQLVKNGKEANTSKSRRAGSASHGKRSEFIEDGYELHDDGVTFAPGKGPNHIYDVKQEVSTSSAGVQCNYGRKDFSAEGYNRGQQLNNGQDEATPKSRAGYSSHGKRSEFNNSSHGRRSEFTDGCNSHNDGLTSAPGRDPDHIYDVKREVDPLNNSGKDVLSGGYYNHGQPLNNGSSTRKYQEEEAGEQKSYCNNSLPPPYIISKDSIIPPPYVKPKESKYGDHKRDKESSSDCDVAVASEDNSTYYKASAGSRSERILIEPEYPDYEEHIVRPPRANSHGHKKDYPHEHHVPLPKPRSVRRKHSKSSSNHDDFDDPEDAGYVKRSSSSRRRENSRRGLQILCSDEHHHKDEEEKMMDKLLLHYSKKPSMYEPGNIRGKSKAHPSFHAAAGAGVASLRDRIRDEPDAESEMLPHPTRSISLPHEQAASLEVNKVFARNNSFQPDGNQARHVHPKLPDYDDLAARFAALRGR